jgi:hypothetical protein
LDSVSNQLRPAGAFGNALLAWLDLTFAVGFKTPQEAISGNYIDKKCPFTSNVSIRGRILK